MNMRMLARCVAWALSAEASPSREAWNASSAFPYLLGTGVLLGLIVAIRLRRKADRDPTRRRK